MSSLAQQLTKITLLTLVAVHLARVVTLASGFSLLNGPLGLFQRHHHHHQQQQQQQQNLAVPQREQLSMMATNSLAPIYAGQFVGAPQHPDLLRLRAINNQADNHHHQGRHHFGPPDQAAYYGHALSALETGHLAVTRPQQGGFQRQQSALDEAAIMAAAAASRPEQQMRLEPSQSEVVDKIERHIGRQIERTLDGHDQVHQMAERLGQRMAAASGFQGESKRAEKETAASGEGHHGGGEEEPSEEAHHQAEMKHEEEEQKVHKVEEKPKEPEEHHHHHHEEQHHHEHMPEAFEVHHKKGGKSFQYFHQGHHP